MLDAGILDETKNKPLNTIALFAVPKADPNNPRMIMDFEKFTKLTNALCFKLPNINKLVRTATKTDKLIKLDLTNLFILIPLHAKTKSMFGIKCQNKYFNIVKLPQGLSKSPYIMQRVMEGILLSLLKNIPVKFLVYLDDIVLMGGEEDLERGKTVLLASSFLFNLPKCDLVPSRIITYLGVKIDLDHETFALTKNFVSKVVMEMIRVTKFRITKRYKQCLAGLLNFAIPILRLPFQFVHLAFHHHNKLYKFVNFVHPYDMSYKTFVNNPPIYTDAAPLQIGIISPHENKLVAYKIICNLPILESEYAAIWIAHAIRPHAVICTENMACLHLFRKGRFPPAWRQNYKLTKLMLETFYKPLIVYINTKKNPADMLSRALLC